VIPERPDYKHHHLWTEAIALAHEAYALADQLRDRDPDAARRLRKVAVSVPARVAGALSAEEAPQREADVVGARAALAELVQRAARPGAAGIEPLSRDLLRRARALEQSVRLELESQANGFVC
jgi:hypothetical protein